MAGTHENWNISGVDTSGQARVHIGHHNEYHDHRYGDESQLSHAERQRAREDAILSSLYFTDMSTREQAIDSPCDGTFGWIFDNKVTELERRNKKDVCNLMSRWLEHEQGMFFIVGKAGSGKSTLMRFLAAHEKTSKLLRRWARRQNCVLSVFAHYFWCSGSQSQSSQEGLWRSILYAIAKEHRELALAVFADRAGDDFQTLAQLRSQPWARNELINALLLLVGQLEVQNVAVCLFIDGLDEYQGDEMILIAELRQLLRSPYIKICASSRPRNLFEEAFGYEHCQWKLALHLLTQGDMLQLTRARLYEDAAFCKLVNREDHRQDFVAAITNRSQGVFLWTVLVIREIIREAHQAGTTDELKARLDALPTELGGEKGMYQRIVERSDPRYRKYMARLLLLMLEAGVHKRDTFGPGYTFGPGPEMVLWADAHFLYYEDRDAAFATRECLELGDDCRLAWDGEAVASAASCRGLFVACHKGRSGAHPRGVNCKVDRIRLIKDTRRQVRKWCPDFVDTNTKDQEGPRFSHRSVGEYLSLLEIRKQMFDLAGQGFDPVLTRCHLRLAHLRLHLDSVGAELIEDTFAEMIACLGHEQKDLVRTILSKFEGIQITKWSSSSVAGNLDGLAGFLSIDYPNNWLGRSVLHRGLDISRSSQARARFLSLAAREGWPWYCHEHWSQIPTSDRQATGTIIIAGLLFRRTGPTMWKEQVVLMQYLLSSGVDPNRKFIWVTPGLGSSEGHFKLSLWEAYVEAFPGVWTTKETNIPRALEMTQLLLHDGHADKQCCLPAGKKSLLSALTFEPDRWLERLSWQNHWWSVFAGQLHEILDAHELLTPKERRVAEEKGWLPTKLKASRSPQTTPTQSASEPNTRRFSRWLRKFKRWEIRR
jgi:hypothetical protein